MNKTYLSTVMAFMPIVCLLAQQPGQRQRSQSQPATQNSRSDNNYRNSNFTDSSNNVFNTESDSFDLQDGRYNWKGKSFDLGQQRLVRARFERYLGALARNRFVGRAPELARIVRHACGADAARKGPLAITGPAGIGKSELIRRAASQCFASLDHYRFPHRVWRHTSQALFPSIL